MTYIIGFGSYLPERIVTNLELASRLEVEPDWIVANSGIRERRWAGPNETASTLAVPAVEQALTDAALAPEQIDYLIGGTLSPDYQVPGIAPLVQRKLAGCRMIPALDVRMACCNILYSLQLAKSLTLSGAAQTVVCFGAEAQSKGLDLSRRTPEISMLFGDGAGACVVSTEPRKNGPSLHIEDILIGTDGTFAEDLGVKSPGTANGAFWLGSESVSSIFPTMNGRTVILHAVRKLAEAAQEIVRRNGLAPEQIDVVVPHQANANLLDALAKKLAISPERIVRNVERYGNTSGASAYIALHQAAVEKRFHPGARVLVLAFGAGFTWGAALCRVVP
ncbi:MAG: ketoacyl-ACP synthase III [Blastocatellia bacterium]|nr:ketoacyl-ACP synthase III [Blastocatellia bacterium]